jgi:PAS domain S-box-containing protein
MTRETRSLARAMRTSPSLAWESFSGGRVKRVNSVSGGLLDRLGYAQHRWESSASFWLDIMPPADRGRVLALIEASFAQPSVPAEFQWTKTNGETISVEAHLRVLRSRSGEIQVVRGLAFDVSARKETERILRESIVTRDHFMAMLAHEMRTPISAILGWAMWMDENGLDRDRSRNALAAIVRSAELQSRLVEDVVDLSRGLFGKLEIAREEVAIEAVLRAACEALRPAATTKRLSLDLQMMDGLACVFGDEGRLIQVLCNLIGNSVKFTPAGGRIAVAAQNVGDQVEIVVVDTGKGLDREQIERLFEPYYQVPSAARLHAGMGLGLFVTRSLVDMHGGQISVDSPGLNQGTRVTVRLPSCAAGREPARYREPLDTGECELEEGDRGSHTLIRQRLPLSA